MPVFGPRFRHLRIVETALWVMLPGFVLPVFAADEPIATETIGAATLSTSSSDVYTINFNNVSIIEYIRFVAKISGSNFVFDENDLRFNVTIVSEDPATLQDIFSALVQVLRINNLSLLEHEGNYLVSRNIAVTQVPAVVTDDREREAPSPPIVTRVFRIKNTNVNSVATIIRPMVSGKALVSVSTETNQLIVSDIATNVDEIANLLASLDAPHSPLDIESYAAKSVAPKDLATMTQLLLAPFTEGNPLIFVPQPETNTLFIVATPHLLERARAILEDLDKPAQVEQLGVSVQQGTVFVYQIQKLPEDILMDRLGEVLDNLKQSSHPPAALIRMLASSRYIKDSNSILFTGDKDTYSKVLEILTTLDVQANAISFFIYPIKNNNRKALENALAQFVLQLKQNHVPDQPLINAVDSMKYMKETDSFIFSGTQDALDRLQTLLPTLDTQASETLKSKGSFIIYQLQNLDFSHLQEALKTVADKIASSPSPDEDLLNAIKTVTYLRDTNSVVFSGTPVALARIREILPTIDLPSKTPVGQGAVFIYQLRYVDQAQLEESLKQLIVRLKGASLPDTNLIQALESGHYIRESNSMVFTGSNAALDHVRDLLPLLDTANAGMPQSTFYIYSPQRATVSDFERALTQFAQNLKSAPTPDRALISALESGRYMKESNSFTFNGDPEAIFRLQQVLPTLDVVPQASQSAFFVYKLMNANEENMSQSLNQFISNLEASPHPDDALITAIRSRRFIKETNSFVFTGDQGALDRLAKLLPSFDVTWAGSTPPGLPPSDTYFLYTPKYRKGEVLLKAVKEMEANLKNSGLNDPALLHTLDTAKWVPSSSAIVFTGDAPSIESIKTLMATVDIPLTTQPEQIFLYKPQHFSHEQLEKSLKNLVSTLDQNNPSDVQLKEAIDNVQWVQNSQSMVFKGTAPTIDRIKQLLASLDSQSAENAQVYFLYKLQYSDPQTTLSYLESVGTNLTTKTPGHQAVQDVIKNAKVIKDNNALLLTGPNDAVEQVKGMIAQYDTPDHATALGPTTFFIYKPQHLPAQQVLKDLKRLVADLAASGNIDPVLKKAIDSIRYTEATDSLVISGTEAAIAQIKTLLDEVDSAKNKGMYQVGAKTFFIYKPQYASAQQLMQSLKTVSKDLAKGGLDDQALAQSIDSMTLIPETNSILFTGTAAALEKIQSIIAKFDIPSMAGAPPTPEIPLGFVIYRPQNKPGDELIEMLCEFVQNLQQTGVSNKPLTDTVNSLRWIPTTCSLLITGQPDAIKQVQDLLHQFDVAAPQAPNVSTTTGAIGETGFLVYKLQYHQGDDIQRALRRVALDLQDAHRGQKIPIAEAIEALQWIPVTNSLLTSGPPDVLSRIRELVQNLDIPLRQVFIEVLVIQTTITNNQSFGLSWAGRAGYNNKLAGQTANLSPSDPLLAPFVPVNTSTFPNPANFNTPQGFDLGMIGDIILHKGKAFFSLGSLVTALELDADAQILLNPKIIAQDSNNATMFFGFNVPFQGSLVTNASSNTVQTSSLEYRNVGHNLSITPTLGSGDVITLDISEDISQVLNNGGITTIANATTPLLAGITTSQTTMSTRVHVPDGAFVCLTGQINETKTHTRQQIPCLGGLPLIGAAFANTNRTNARANVIIFMRPQIVKSPEEYKRITEHQEDLFRSRNNFPYMKEEYDEGLDWIKTPDNE